MTLFIAVVDKGGLAAGGREVGLSPASVSERIAALEERSGVRLLNRTTRSLALTDEGELFAESARNILAEVKALDRRLTQGSDSLAGNIRIAAPFDLGRNRLAQLLDQFMVDHPAVSVELILSDGIIDLVGNRIDCALRYGNLPDSGLRARKIGSNRRVVCASPDYLTRHGIPKCPEDLTKHNCLIMVFGDQANNRWRFQVDGEERILSTDGNRRSNDGEVIRDWALRGLGVARKSIWDISEHLESGSLVELLKAFSPTENSLQIVYPDGHSLPQRTRMLIDTIAAAFSDPELN